MITKKTISINDLNFWPDNPRFINKGLRDNQKDILNYLIANENYKVRELAERLAEDIEAPLIENLVVYLNRDKNIVYEGNRRLAAYKALMNPLLVNDEATREKFNKLKIDMDSKFNYPRLDVEVDCLVTSDREKAFEYIVRKHNSPNDPVYERSWGDLERANFNIIISGDDPAKEDLLKVEIADRIGEFNFPGEYGDKVLGPGYVTTLFRMVAAKSVKTLKITYEDGNVVLPDTEDFNNTLGIIIMDVLEKATFKEKPLSRLNADEIIEYIEDTSSASKRKEYKKWVRDIGSTGDAPMPEKPKQTRNRRSYEYLIPSDCNIDFTNDRASEIFAELQYRLILSAHSQRSVPNAIGVLFRVFLEISLREYGSVFGINFGRNTRVKEMLEKIVKHLEARIEDKNQLDSIKKVSRATPAESILAIETFHEYVHSKDFVPTIPDLKNKWKRLQVFFEILWAEIKKQKYK